MRTLQRLKVTNFKSIREQELQLQPLNVFIGGNGAGKSNLISVFTLLKAIVDRNLANYTQKRGGADTLLYHGRKRSPEMEIEVEFGEGETSNGYTVRLAGTDEDTLFIANETASYWNKKSYSRPYTFHVSSGERESNLRNANHQCPKQILTDLEKYRVHHFHDTSETAKVKGVAEVDDNRYLQPQAENLAAFLYYLQQRKQRHFSLIEDTVRHMVPFFGRFQLAPSKLNPSRIRLEWQEQGSDAYFNASSLSDGTLRFICLATLLLQPDLPSLVLLDEPELGLHPAAITLLAAMLHSASQKTQVIVATQSVTLVNQFSPETLWTVDREDGQSVFRQLETADKTNWLEEYALGDLWEKNLLGARP